MQGVCLHSLLDSLAGAGAGQCTAQLGSPWGCLFFSLPRGTSIMALLSDCLDCHLLQHNSVHAYVMQPSRFKQCVATSQKSMSASPAPLSAQPAASQTDPMQGITAAMQQQLQMLSRAVEELREVHG